MSVLIDEHTAWNLVRAIPAGLAGSASALVRNDPRPDVWLQVHDSGRWEASHEVNEAGQGVLNLYLPLKLRADVVIAQLGQSLDGRIATPSGHSHYVTGPADIRRLHRLRALVDAVIVGAGTVRSDNPRLTVREVEGVNPTRVILDPDARLDTDRAVFTDGAARTIVVYRAGSDAPASPGREVVTLPAGREGFEPRDVLAALRKAGCRRFLVEGGGITVSRFVRAGVVDRLHVAVAPLLIGSGPPALTLPPITTLDQAMRPPCRHFPLGDDLLFDLDLSGYQTPPS